MPLPSGTDSMLAGPATPAKLREILVATSSSQTGKYRGGRPDPESGDGAGPSLRVAREAADRANDQSILISTRARPALHSRALPRGRMVMVHGAPLSYARVMATWQLVETTWRHGVMASFYVSQLRATWQLVGTPKKAAVQACRRPALRLPAFLGTAA